MTHDDDRVMMLESQLSVLRKEHETLGAAYRDACAELGPLRKEVSDLRGRLVAMRILCEVLP